MHTGKRYSSGITAVAILVIALCSVAVAGKVVLPATVRISVTPDVAPWTLTAPDGTTTAGQGDQTLTGPAGRYTVRWGVIPDLYALPAVTTISKNVKGGSTATFTGVYRVAAPAFNLAAGLYTTPIDVEISCATPGSAIHYTTNGTTPTASSPVYTGALHLTSTKTIKALATAPGLGNSDIATRTYTVDTQPPVATAVTSTPAQVASTVDLSMALAATASDAGTGNTNIVAAWYFIGADPGDGHRQPMQATDGSFSSPAEAIRATIDTSAWVIGTTYTISVIARDQAGFDSAPASVDVPCVKAPDAVVSASAADASAAEPVYGQPATDTGRITISRTGSTASALTVNYTVSGTATNGVDYDTVASPIVIPAGASSASIAVTPIGDTATEGSETVTVSIAEGSNYTIGASGSATVTIADSSASGPTYNLAGSDDVSSTATTAWQSKVSTAFRPSVADDWVIFASVEYTNSSTSSRTHVRVIQDGVTKSEAGSRPEAVTDYIPFVTAYKTTLIAATHRISIDFSCDGGGPVGYVRNAHIVAVRKAGLEVWAAPTPDKTWIVGTMMEQNSLTWTPAAPGDYLLIYSTEFAGQASYTHIQAIFNGGIVDDVLCQAAGPDDSYSFVNFSKVTCDATPQTMSIAAQIEHDSPALHQMRHCRLLAVRLSDGRFAGAVTASDSSERTTASTDFLTQLTASWAANASGNWLLLTSFDICGSNTLYSTEARIRANATIVSGQPMSMPVREGAYLSAGSVDARLLGTADHLDIDFRSTSNAYTAMMKCMRIVALPLD